MADQADRTTEIPRLRKVRVPREGHRPREEWVPDDRGGGLEQWRIYDVAIKGTELEPDNITWVGPMILEDIDGAALTFRPPKSEDFLPMSVVLSVESVVMVRVRRWSRQWERYTE